MKILGIKERLFCIKSLLETKNEYISRTQNAEIHDLTQDEYQHRLQAKLLWNHALIDKRPEWATRHEKVIFLYDNAQSHAAKAVRDTISAHGWELLPFPPYSPDFQELSSCSNATVFLRFLPPAGQEMMRCTSPLFFYLFKDSRCA